MHDGPNQWDNRKQQVVDLIDEYDLNFIGLQEVLPMQFDYLRRELNQFSWIYRTRETDPSLGEGTPIGYLTSEWDTVWTETFWLSATPEIPGSNTWQAACNRVATWALFTHMHSGDSILVCNTHYDHIAQEAREKSSLLIMSKLEDSGLDCPFILMGDLNAAPNNPSVLTLTDKLYDPYLDFHASDSVHGTFNGFKGIQKGNRIDYIFFQGISEVGALDIVRDHVNGQYPSDHFPIFSEFIMR